MLKVMHFDLFATEVVRLTTVRRIAVTFEITGVTNSSHSF